MKKFLFTFVLMLGLVACGGNVTPTNTEDATDSIEAVGDSATIDTISVDPGCVSDTVVIAD
jgi:hypothetical protein